MSVEEMKEIMVEIAEIIGKYPEALQEKAFDIMTENIFGRSKKVDEITEEITPMENETVINIDENTVDSNSIGKRNKRRNVSKDNFQINKDLNLSPRETQSLKDFVEEKQPKSNIEFNVVAIYYLERILKKTDISIDDIYACYKNVNKKVPAALKQSLTDTSSSKYGYISVSNNCFSIPVAGENFVEFELPKK